MSTLKVGKIQSGISLTPANNMVLDASADDGSFVFKREDGSVIFTVDATGKIDMDGTGIFQKDNILGTVSQTLGVPTGAIIERGSNANGEYVKFADGTMICNQTFPGTKTTTISYFGIFYDTGLIWTFPAVFIAVPSSFGDTIVSLGLPWVVIRNTEVTAVNLFVQGFTNTDAVASITVVSIGRWF